MGKELHIPGATPPFEPKRKEPLVFLDGKPRPGYWICPVCERVYTAVSRFERTKLGRVCMPCVDGIKSRAR